MRIMHSEKQALLWITGEPVLEPETLIRSPLSYTEPPAKARGRFTAINVMVVSLVLSTVVGLMIQAQKPRVGSEDFDWYKVSSS